jgi:hypothetical protein
MTNGFLEEYDKSKKVVYIANGIKWYQFGGDRCLTSDFITWTAWRA